MKNLVGIIALVIFEIVSFTLFVEIDAASKFGLWALIFGVTAFKRFLNLRDNKMYTGIDSYHVLAVNQKADNTHLVKKQSLIEQFNTKWLYLFATLINGGMCFYLIKFQ